MNVIFHFHRKISNLFRFESFKILRPQTLITILISIPLITILENLFSLSNYNYDYGDVLPEASYKWYIKI
jgi:hypothetical protein